MHDISDTIIDIGMLDLVSVKTINIMFNRWTDKHRAVHFLKLQGQCINNDWVRKVAMLTDTSQAEDAYSIL